MKVTKIEKTCYACPAQWEGTLEDGRMFYIRYRWGGLSIEVSKKPTTDIYKAMGSDANMIYCENLSDSLDGFLEEEELFPIMKQQGFKLEENEKTE